MPSPAHAMVSPHSRWPSTRRRHHPAAGGDHAVRTTQRLTIATDPPAATCQGERRGAVLFSASRSAIVSKSRNPIRITCSAPGFEDATMSVDSSVSAMGIAGALTVDFGITDYATGALNKYPETVAITLKPKAR